MQLVRPTKKRQSDFDELQVPYKVAENKKHVLLPLRAPQAGSKAEESHAKQLT